MRPSFGCAAALSLMAACWISASTASAAPFIPDEYWGGNNPINSGDIIGTASVFNISGVSVERVNPNTLSVVVTTSYAGVPGTPAALTTGYGSLFFGPTLPSLPSFAASNTDIYAAGRFSHVFDINSHPGSGAQSNLTGNLYAV